MELEKEDRTRNIKDVSKKELAKDFYDRCIPTDKPLFDELHIKFHDDYRDSKSKDIEVKGKRLGAPLATGEYGIIHDSSIPKE
jgi:hypothetical protein